MILRIARHSVYVITSDSHTHSTDEETEFQRSEWLEKLNQDSSQEFFSLNPILLSLEQIYSPPPSPPSFPSKDGKQVICLLFSKESDTIFSRFWNSFFIGTSWGTLLPWNEVRLFIKFYFSFKIY